MRFFYVLAALAASTIAAPHAAPSDGSSSSPFLQQQQQHNLNKRQMRTLAQPGATSKAIPSRDSQDASKRQAFDIGSSNYDRHIGKSLAAQASGGRTGVAAIWASYVPADGNPYAQLYAGNGKGDLARAKANAQGLENGKGAGNSQAKAVVAMMEQLGMMS